MQHQAVRQSMVNKSFYHFVQTFTGTAGQTAILKGIQFEFGSFTQVISMQTVEPTVYTSPRSRHRLGHTSSELAIRALKTIFVQTLYKLLQQLW